MTRKTKSQKQTISRPSVRFDGLALTGYLRQRTNGYWYKDLRTPHGERERDSLHTTSLEEARKEAQREDREAAIEFGLLPPVAAEDRATLLSIDDGLELAIATRRGPRTAGGVKESSLTKYQQQDRDFVAFCAESGVKVWSQVDTERAHRYAGWLKDKGNHETTIHGKLIRLKSVIKALIKLKRLPTTFELEISHRKPQARETHCYTPEQNVALIERAYAINEETAARMIMFMSKTGLRVGEACQLEWRDLQRTDKGLVVRVRDDGERTTKSGESRSVPVVSKLAVEIEQWPRRGDKVFIRESRRPADSGWLLRVLQTKLIPPLADRFSDPQVDGEFTRGTVHGFRHFFISRCVIDGVSRDQIQRLVGHRGSKVIDRYIHIHGFEHRKRLEAVQFEPDKSNAESGYAPPDTKAMRGA